jgi:hypothetical protein
VLLRTAGPASRTTLLASTDRRLPCAARGADRKAQIVSGGDRPGDGTGVEVDDRPCTVSGEHSAPDL